MPACLAAGRDRRTRSRVRAAGRFAGAAVLSLPRSRRLELAAFAWGIAEATLFFIVPDVLLSYVGLRHGARAAVRASVVAALGACVGGAAMYAWSVTDPAAAREAVLAVPAIGTAMVDRAEQAIAEHWLLATFLGPLTSTPFKVYAVLAPAHAPLPAFVLATIAVRLPRFLLVSVGVALLGSVLRRRLGEKTLLAMLAGGWLLFYAAFFALMPD